MAGSSRGRGKSRTGYLLRQIAKDRGFANENRVAEALTFLSENDPPPWFKGWDKATPEQDRKGIDYVVHTYDIGDLYLQVKSSHAGCKKFNGRRRKQLIAVLLVQESNLLDKLHKSLVFLRNEVLRIRS